MNRSPRQRLLPFLTALAFVLGLVASAWSSASDLQNLGTGTWRADRGGISGDIIAVVDPCDEAGAAIWDAGPDACIAEPKPMAVAVAALAPSATHNRVSRLPAYLQHAALLL